MGTRAVWLVALAGVGWSGCGGAAERAAPPPIAPEPVVADPAAVELGLHPGETMQFEVSLGGLVAGEAALAVGELEDRDGRRVLAVRSRLATVGAAAMIKTVVDDATTVIDADTRRPIEMSTDVVYGSTEYVATATWGPLGAIVDIVWERKDSSAKGTVHFDFKGQLAHDAHSAMAEIREWRAGEGARRTLWVVGGRKLWRADLVVGPRETLGTAMGNRPTIRLEGTAYRARNNLALDPARKPRTFTVWVSDDADRVPLRVRAGTELGDVTIDLVEYRRP